MHPFWVVPKLRLRLQRDILCIVVAISHPPRCRVRSTIRLYRMLTLTVVIGGGWVVVVVDLAHRAVALEAVPRGIGVELGWMPAMSTCDLIIAGWIGDVRVVVFVGSHDGRQPSLQDQRMGDDQSLSGADRRSGKVSTPAGKARRYDGNISLLAKDGWVVIDRKREIGNCQKREVANKKKVEAGSHIM